MSRTKPIKLNRKQKFAMDRLTARLHREDPKEYYAEGPHHYLVIPKKKQSQEMIKFIWVVAANAWLPVEEAKNDA